MSGLGLLALLAMLAFGVGWANAPTSEALFPTLFFVSLALVVVDLVIWALPGSTRRVLIPGARNRRPRMPGDLKAALKRAAELDPPMPSDGASETEWEAWANLQEVQSLLAGWPKRNPDRWYSELQSALEQPGVRRLMGSAVDDAIRVGRWIADTTPDHPPRSPTKAR